MISPDSPALRRAWSAMRPADTIERAIAIQQIAAPTFAEGPRAEYIAREWRALGLQDVKIDEVGNVLARRSGGRARPVLITAHTDTVFPAETPLTIERGVERIYGPGLGDNAMGVAGLFALADTLDAAAIETPGEVWLAANVGEEGLGNLRGMRHLMKRFAASVRATIILEGMSFGSLHHQAISVHRLRITANAAGGHSWSDFGQPSAVHGLVQLAAHLTAVPLPASPKTTLNIGQIYGGTSVNTIAREAALELDLRSEDTAALAAVVEEVEQAVRSFDRPGISITATITGQRPAGAIPREHPLVKLAVAALQAVGTPPTYERGSTDANIPLSQSLPAVCIGLCRGGNAHRPDEYIEPAMLENGLKQLMFVALGAFEL